MKMIKSTILYFGSSNNMRIWITDESTKKFGLCTKVSIDKRLKLKRDKLVSKGLSYSHNERYYIFHVKNKTVEECINFF